MANIAIIGAGLLGRLTCLCYQNHQVTLFDPLALDDEQHTGLIAAAMLAPTAESAISSNKVVALGNQSLELWPELLKLFDWQHVFHQAGTIVLAHPADKGAIAHFINQVKPEQQVNFTSLSTDSLINLEPELAKNWQQSLYLNGEGHIDNDILYQLSSKYIQTSNIRFKKQSIDLDDGSLEEYDLVIDCRGMGAKGQTRELLRGVRGEVIRVNAPDVHLTRPIRLMHPRYPLYIVPKTNNNYVIGATEIESESTSPTTVRSALELLSAAYSVHKGFAEATITSIKSSLRPAFSDNEPSISSHGKVIQINGLYRHGYMITPAIINMLTQRTKQQFNIRCDAKLEKLFTTQMLGEQNSGATYGN